MGYNAKTYIDSDQIIHVGGDICIDEGVTITGLGDAIHAGIASNIPTSTADTVEALRGEFNALIKSLKAAGLMVPDKTK